MLIFSFWPETNGSKLIAGVVSKVYNDMDPIMLRVMCYGLPARTVIIGQTVMLKARDLAPVIRLRVGKTALHSSIGTWLSSWRQSNGLGIEVYSELCI